MIHQYASDADIRLQTGATASKLVCSDNTTVICGKQSAAGHESLCPVAVDSTKTGNSAQPVSVEDQPAPLEPLHLSLSSTVIILLLLPFSIPPLRYISHPLIISRAPSLCCSLL